MRVSLKLALILTSLALAGLSLAANKVVINEIHHNPDVKTEPVQFVELHNAGTNHVDLTGWQFSDGIGFAFTNGPVLAPGSYVVIAENPAALAAKYGVSGALGPFSGGLSKDGEKLTLRNADGDVEDEVEYQLGFPWPTVGDPPGYSIELINPHLDNNLAGSWRASVAGSAAPSPESVLIDSGSTWKHFKGTAEASAPTTAWRLLSFNDSAWLSGPAPIGYDPAVSLGTTLGDMRSNYTAVFFRKTFVVEEPGTVTSLLLEALYDDGFKVWINGSNVLNMNISASEVTFDGVAGAAREDGTYNLFTINNPAPLLVQGTNIIAIQAHNTSRTDSSDFYLDARLRALTGTSDRGPTPGRLNSAYVTNAPPQIRQVAHAPDQPASGQSVKITAKVTDPDGVASVVLQYQVVLPGQYIDLTEPAYTNAANWASLPMNDAGTDGDLAAGDDIFSADIPASVQAHRRLVRYRITVTDSHGLSVRVPYADDPQPNFAYFVYDGLPEWRAAIQPGAAGTNGTVLTFSSNVLGRLPTYHLLSKKDSVEFATGWRQAGSGGGYSNRYTGDLYFWPGALVYEGKVYDHIRFRARGGVWRYAMVKNMWKFDLNRGHDFEARDHWGRKFQTKWSKLNLGACIQQGNFQHRGEQGMFESVGFRLFQLAGLPAPKTSFATFRVIDEAVEASPASQYEGDFWGLYLALEQEGGRFLDEHDLPDSNLYKMEGGTGTLNNLGPTGPSDKSDLTYLLGNYNGATDAWWRTNWNLAKYWSYQCVVQAIHHFDISDGKNYFYYFNPATRLWEVIPWDLDLTWAHNMYRTDVGGCGVDALGDRILAPIKETGSGLQAGTGVMRLSGSRPAFEMEFRNRLREFRDLLWNTNQAYKLIDEQAALLRGPTNGPTILDADRCQWDYNPKMNNDALYSSSPGQGGQGRFYQFPLENASLPVALRGSFNAAVQVMKNYVVTRSDLLDSLSADFSIPSQPSISYVGPTNYPINRLSFRASSYSGVNPFASMKWRLAEIRDPSTPSFQTDEPWKYEIETTWESAPLPVFSSDITLPVGALRAGSTYRVRVQFTDATGRSSNWSPPVEFVAGQSDTTPDLLNHLRITEVMYNPPAGGFEFIELHNASPSLTLDLNGVSFTAGLTFTFGPGATIPPGGYLVLTKAPTNNNFAAFRAFHGLTTNTLAVGPFVGSLANDGERIALSASAHGETIVEFTYGDGRGWPTAANKAGHSLVLLDSAESAQGSGAGEYGANWRASTYLRGSPGQADPPPLSGVLLNEIAAHTDHSDPLHPEYDSNDWIELFNPTAADITLGPGWYLSDDGANLLKWQLPSNTIVPARGWVSFDEVTGFHNPTNTGFGLNKAGEQVFLAHLPGNTLDRVVDAVTFKGQENGWTLGRYPDGAPSWYALTPTRDSTNAAPGLHVVINELLYHPPEIGGTNDNGLDEFIELHNPTASAVPLFNTNGTWRLDGTVGFSFPINLSLAPGELLLIVNFDPMLNIPQLVAFKSLYGITNEGLAILGPYSGKLANSSGRVALEQPQAPDLPGDPVSWVIVDEVIYADQPPWPCGADGTGASLQRQHQLGSGNDPMNWAGAAPTGGRENPILPPGTPVITAAPQARTIAVGSSTTFAVSACGTPQYFQWLFHGTNLPAATNTTFTVLDAQVANAGPYAVVAWNSAGSVTSAPALLTVLRPPVFTLQPRSQTVLSGTTVTFEVAVSGDAPLALQWAFRGKDVPGETNLTLTLTNVQFARTGPYQVRAVNPVGTVFSDVAQLIIPLPLSITTPPQSQSLFPYTNLTLSVGLAGSPAAYQWRFHGTNLPGANNATLFKPGILPADAGPYSVVITNTISAVTSAPAVLLVYTNPLILTQPVGRSASLGSNATFNVVAVSSTPLRYQWYFNTNTALANATNDSYNILNVQATNYGYYNVRVWDSFGSNWSDPAQMADKLKPAIFQQPTPPSGAGFPGSNYCISISAYGPQPLTYNLRKNGNVFLSQTLNDTNCTFTLTNLVFTNCGSYEVIVTNIAGNAPNSSRAYLTVMEPLTNRFTWPGSNVTFSFQAASLMPNSTLSSNNFLKYQWWFNETNLVSTVTNLKTTATNIVLNLTNVQAAQEGSYTVVLTNANGLVTNQTATLTLWRRPVITQQPTNQNVPAGSDAAFSVSADGTAPLRYQWWFNQTNLLADATAPTLSLTSVQPIQTGAYRVIITNSVGAITSEVATLTITITEAPHFDTVLAPPMPGGPLQFGFGGQAGQNYAVLWREQLGAGDWAVLTNIPTLGTSQPVLIQDETAGRTQRFYRIVTPSP